MAQSPEDKKPDFSNFPRGAIGIKGLPVGRNARLPSIRTPRDLTLGSQPKRTFKPNIPVRREKKSTDSVKDGSESKPEIPSNRNSRNTTPKSERGRGRGRGKAQVIQLEGAVFGEGIAQSAARASSSRQRESLQRSEFSSGRPYIKKEEPDYDVHHMEQEMKMLLRDDFIDDEGDSNSGDESLKPVIFPAKKMKVKQVKSENDEKSESFQSQDFAKTMGFDMEKIAKFIKKEKLDEPAPEAQPDWSRVPKNQITELLTSRDTPFYMLQIPKCITNQTNEYQSKAVDNAASSSNEEKKDATSLAALPEGSVGRLQILKSGRVRLKIGSLHYYIDEMKPLIGKCELASIETDSGDLVSLGSSEKLLVLEPDLDSLMPESLYKES